MIFCISCLRRCLSVRYRALCEGVKSALKVRYFAFVPTGGGYCRNAQDAVFVLWEVILVIIFHAFEEKNKKKFASSLFFV